MLNSNMDYILLKKKGNTFEYSSSNPLNGILHSLYDQNNGEYSKYIKIFATSYLTTEGRDLSPEHAFDYGPKDDNYYWLGSSSQEGPINLTFCFINYYAKITGFEIQTLKTSIYRPVTFSLSASVDNKTYTTPEEYSEDFTSTLVHYFSFTAPISKCFCLTCIKNNVGGRAFDLDHIEIYGDIHKSLDLFAITSKSTLHFLKHTLLLLFVVIGK